MVVDRHDGVEAAFCKCPYKVCNAFLHFGVGTLNGVQLYGACVSAGVYRRYRATAHTDAVVVATGNYHGLTRLGLALYGIARGCESHTAGKHYHLVVAPYRAFFFMLESKQGAADKGLAKFISEVRCAVRRFYKDVGRVMV